MKILVIEMSNLGDAILTYPALSALWERYPEAQMHLLSPPRARMLFQDDPRIYRLWDWADGMTAKAALVGKLMRERFDLVIDFRNSLTPFFLGARRTPFLRRSPGRAHKAETHLALVTAMGVPPASRVQPLPFGPEEEREVKLWLNPAHPTVLVAPGSRSHTKRWNPEGFAELADLLAEKQGAQIILVGDEQERPITKHVRGIMRQAAADCAGKTTLRQLAALLSKAALVVTNDSAMLHAAETMGTPVVAVFGPTDDKKYGPRSPRSAIIRRTLHCTPCEKALCRYNHECMTGITPEEVHSAAARLLKNGCVTTRGEGA